MLQRFGLAGLYLAACLAAAAFIAWRILGGGALDTDIQSLLPAGALKPPVREAMVQAGAAASSRVAMLVSADDPDTARTAADVLVRRLNASGVFADVAADGEQTARWMFAGRNQLLCEPPADFTAATAESVVQQSLAQIYSPAGPVTGDLLKRDPFLLTMRLTGCLLPATGFGAASMDGSILISGRLTTSAYRLDTQGTFIGIVDAWTQEYAPRGVRLDRAGAAFHADDGARHARRDISTVGVASTVGIILLLLFVFRRPRVLPLTLMVIGAGYLGSIAAVLAVFPAVHMLTFVFGAAFVGITADYAIYYLTTGPMTGWGALAERRGLIFRPVTACMVTSAIGFGCLGLFGVPLFQQIAVFAAGGLVSAWACAFLVAPLLDPQLSVERAGRLTDHWNRLQAGLARARWTRITLVLFFAVFAVGAVVAATRFAVLDDVRKFQPRSAQLMVEEQRVRDAAGIGFSPNFLLTWGPDADAARRREAQVLRALPPETAASLLAVSRLDPPAAERAAAEAAIRQTLIGPRLAERAALLGMDPGEMEPFWVPAGDIGRPDWLEALTGQTGRLHFLIAPVPEEATPAVIAAVAGANDAAYINPADAYGQAFAAYRQTATLAVIAAFVAVGLVLLLMYRSVSALGILVAPALGVAGGVVAALALGQPLSFFSMMGAFVVVGTGADYSILRYEAARGGRSPLAGLPILITALTAILSMGLLSLSSTYPVRAFGIAVAAGLAISYALSSVAAWFGGRDSHVRQG